MPDRRQKFPLALRSSSSPRLHRRQEPVGVRSRDFASLVIASVAASDEAESLRMRRRSAATAGRRMPAGTVAARGADDGLQGKGH